MEEEVGSKRGENRDSKGDRNGKGRLSGAERDRELRKGRQARTGRVVGAAGVLEYWESYEGEGND